MESPLIFKLNAYILPQFLHHLDFKAIVMGDYVQTLPYLREYSISSADLTKNLQSVDVGLIFQERHVKLCNI